jgi:hypothetical protein
MNSLKEYIVIGKMKSRTIKIIKESLKNDFFNELGKVCPNIETGIERFFLFSSNLKTN